MSMLARSRVILAFVMTAGTAALVAGSAHEARAQQAEAQPTEAEIEAAAEMQQQSAPPQPEEAVLAQAEQAPQGEYPADAPEWDQQTDPGAEGGADAPLIPPNVEGPAYPMSDGSYCYVGPHPVDTRIVPGPSWDDTQGQHTRPYAPIDTRLFAFRDGCYYFTGDPRDFGYGGQTYAYYGAHPILDGYGGGWCFMMGPHTHVWAPWSPYFTVVGSWYYWHGPFDPFFWAYWPYYSFYYRSYYPSFYGGGRFYRGGGWRVAPSIRPGQVQAWRGSRLRTAPVYRGSPAGAPAAGAYRGAGAAGVRNGAPGARPGMAPGYHPMAPGYHPGAPPSYHPGGAPAGGAPGYHPSAPTYHPAAPAFHPGPAARPSFSPGPAPRSFAPSGGGFHGGGGGFRRR